ncbi:MAG: DUF3572 domain-containing protein [Pseudomonadota bacterium]
MIAASAAERIGKDALLFLAERPEEFMRFLTVTGSDVEAVRARTDDPEMHGFVLDFLMSDEALAQQFCDGHALSPETFAAARAMLPGGDAPHWL